MIVFLKRPVTIAALQFSCINDGKLPHSVGTEKSVSTDVDFMENRTSPMHDQWTTC